jgi:thiol:disulfide interchange protein DsbD
MRSLKLFLLLVPILLASKLSIAQMIEDPTSWKYEVKKKSATEYQLIFHLTLKQGFHIWSLHPGGDGYEISPSFTIDKNDKVTAVGTPTESGKAVTTTMDGIDGKITYLNGKIDYVQNVTVKGPTKITGKHQYQVCNDKMCLPPKDKNFSFDIK